MFIKRILGVSWPSKSLNSNHGRARFGDDEKYGKSWVEKEEDEEGNEEEPEGFYEEKKGLKRPAYEKPEMMSPYAAQGPKDDILEITPIPRRTPPTLSNLPLKCKVNLLVHCTQVSCDTVFALAAVNREYWEIFRVGFEELWKVQKRSFDRRKYYAAALFLRSLEGEPEDGVQEYERYDHWKMREDMDFLVTENWKGLLSREQKARARIQHEKMLWLAWYGVYRKQWLTRGHNERSRVWSDSNWGNKVGDWLPVVYFTTIISMISLNDEVKHELTTNQDFATELFRISFGAKRLSNYGITKPEVFKLGSAAKFHEIVEAFDSSFDTQVHVRGPFGTQLKAKMEFLHGFKKDDGNIHSPFEQYFRAFRHEIRRDFVLSWTRCAIVGDWNFVVVMLRSDREFDEFVQRFKNDKALANRPGQVRDPVALLMEKIKIFEKEIGTFLWLFYTTHHYKIIRRI